MKTIEQKMVTRERTIEQNLEFLRLMCGGDESAEKIIRRVKRSIMGYIDLAHEAIADKEYK